MKKIKLKETKIIKSFKKNSKVIFAYFLGMVVSAGTVYAATSAAGVSFDPSGSGLGSDITNVQSAIDKVYADTVDYSSLSNQLEDKISEGSVSDANSKSSVKFLTLGKSWTGSLRHLSFTCYFSSNYCNINDFVTQFKSITGKSSVDIQPKYISNDIGEYFSNVQMKTTSNLSSSTSEHVEYLLGDFSLYMTESNLILHLDNVRNSVGNDLTDAQKSNYLSSSRQWFFSLTY